MSPHGNIVTKREGTVPDELHILGGLDLVLEAVVNAVDEVGVETHPVVQGRDDVRVAKRVWVKKGGVLSFIPLFFF